MVKNIKNIAIASHFKPMNTKPRSNIQMESQVLGVDAHQYGGFKRLIGSPIIRY
jgi:hypothetical protein